MVYNFRFHDAHPNRLGIFSCFMCSLDIERKNSGVFFFTILLQLPLCLNYVLLVNFSNVHATNLDLLVLQEF